MPEYLAPGVFVEEVSGGVKPIAGVSTSTIGMIGLTERGPVDTPTLVTSFGAFTRTFGGLLNQRVYTDNRYALPNAVQQAFDNGAGRIYVNRIVGADATFGMVDLLGNAVVDPAATALSTRAVAGATVLEIDDGANLGAGDSLLIQDGRRSEYVLADSPPTAVGLALSGALHAAQPDAAPVVLQAAPGAGADLTAGVTGDMSAGEGLALDDATVAALGAGDIIEISQADDPALTEYVTVAAAGTADINEGGLLFEHPQATVAVRTVTLADDAATSTTVDGPTPAGSGLLPLTDTSGIAAGDVIAVNAGPAREFHVVRAIVSALSISTTPTTAIHEPGVAILRQTPLLRVHARDQGGWSDRLQIRISASPLAETAVANAAGAGASPITLGSAVGLHVGSVVSIRRGGAEIARQRVIGVNQGDNEADLQGGAAVALQAGDTVVSQEITMIVELLDADGRVSIDEAFGSLAMDPEHPRYAPRIVGAFDRAADEPEAAGLSTLIRLSSLSQDDNGVDLAGAAEARLAVPFDGVTRRLDGGSDDLANVNELTYRGTKAADAVDNTGIFALELVDDISIVAVPGQPGQIVQNAMLTHCELMRYRIAVLDSVPNARLADIQTQRGLYDSTRGALYYPWFQVADPFGRVGDRLLIPPSGAVCGAYARTDNERGVHKAPANVVVRNILDLNANITTGEQEILNPRGINVIRSFRSSNRGIQIWGARTISSDPEWRYVPVRRLFLFLEESIDRGTQFAVFEPNDPTLWATISRSVTNFLTAVWRDGALFGATPEEAFFVDVGLNTMTQDDIDNGRLIVNIGIAPVRPAEFVIFRISQKTAGAPA